MFTGRFIKRNISLICKGWQRWVRDYVQQSYVWKGQAWYRWSDTRMPFRCWEDLKNRLLERFQASQESSLQEQFLDIRQIGSAVGRFEQMDAQLEGIQESILEGTFIMGLKPNLRKLVQILQPQGLG
ncbi:unnamed protein product [Lactuca saligna]|uniref:Retrotransposon gag domain-containing protein n=1 Tax=Lactuca saligna TaxID=75948 RepID=A0AA35ZEJ3_LACSI|nr:unnamed protein product [Lactuca saligna]